MQKEKKVVGLACHPASGQIMQDLTGRKEERQSGRRALAGRQPRGRGAWGRTRKSADLVGVEHESTQGRTPGCHAGPSTKVAPNARHVWGSPR